MMVASVASSVNSGDIARFNSSAIPLTQTGGTNVSPVLFPATAPTKK